MQRSRGHHPKQRRREAIQGIAFVLPAALLFLIFRIIPAFAGAGLSAFRYRIGGVPEFIGFENYVRIWNDPIFAQALKVTVIYTALAVPLTICASVAVAMLVRRKFPGVFFFRSVYFLPVITSLVLAGGIFGWIFSSAGPWSQFLNLLGLPSESWLASRTLVIPVIVLVGVWARFGYGMLIVLAALQDVPREVEEAAMVDGATRWQSFRYIVLPFLRPVVFFLLILETSVSFQVFDFVFVLTQGGPSRGSYTLVYMLYDYAFRYGEFGFAAAIGVCLLVMTMAVALVQRKVVGKND